MKLFAALLLLFFSFSCLAQEDPGTLQKIMGGNGRYEDRIKAYIRFATYYELKDFDSTIDAASHGIALARKNGDSVSVAELKLAMGVASYFKGSYDVAARNYYESAAILEKTDQKIKLANVYNEIAKLYRKTRDLDRSLENYNKAEAIFRELKDSAGIAMILNESGVIFEYRGDYDEAVKRYSASKDLAGVIHDSLSISYSLSNIAGVNVIQKKYDEAEKNLLAALAIRRNLGDSFSLALTWSDLGATMRAKGDYTKAAAYLEESNRLARSLNYPELQSNNYNELSAVASAQSNYQKALEYFKKRTELRDSIFSQEKTNQIEELEKKYQTVRKEQIIEQQHNRIVRQNFIFLGLAGLALMIGLLIYSQYKRYRLRQKAELQAEIMKQQAIATQAVIEAEEEERQRIARDLHDGVGQMMSAAKMNLSAFESEIIFASEDQKTSFEKIIRLVDDSCREVRNVSHIMMPHALLKNNLASALNDFINKLDKKALEVHLYTEGLDESLDSNTETVLYRVIQECVNNVIKHSGASSLDISIIRDKDGINASIEDNGRGFDTSDKGKFEGIGLKNIITRIEFLKGSVEFDSAPGRGTVVGLHVPSSKSI